MIWGPAAMSGHNSSTDSSTDSQPTPTQVWAGDISRDERYGHMLKMAQSSVMPSDNDWHTPEQVAEVAADLNCGIWHASYMVTVRAIEQGDMVLNHCVYCHGRLAPNADTTYHHLCHARASRDRITPRIDWEPMCGCFNCEQEERNGR